jgi:HD-GYP domain-containing protein (c-di-GMP phosphodiesterase class II)
MLSSGLRRSRDAPPSVAETDTTSAIPEAGALPESVAATVEALSRALELHDYRRGELGETRAHITRVTNLALALAEFAAPELAQQPQLEFGFRLHDIGMIGVPNDTLEKRGLLSRAEVDEIREHPWLGERIVAPVQGLHGTARDVIACHHERWDGSGYPRGLHGVEIPLAARIFAIADTFDAMTHDQPYRTAISVEAALSEIAASAGTSFDPELTATFLALQATLDVAPATTVVTAEAQPI